MIITINKEDFNVANKFNVKKVKYIHGVGIDYDTINNMKVDEIAFRKNINVPNDAFLLTSIGELSSRKNFGIVIDAIHNVDNDFVVLKAGEGGMLYPYASRVWEITFDYNK